MPELIDPTIGVMCSACVLKIAARVSTLRVYWDVKAKSCSLLIYNSLILDDKCRVADAQSTVCGPGM